MFQSGTGSTRNVRSNSSCASGGTPRSRQGRASAPAKSAILRRYRIQAHSRRRVLGPAALAVSAMERVMATVRLSPLVPVIGFERSLPINDLTVDSGIRYFPQFIYDLYDHSILR